MRKYGRQFCPHSSNTCHRISLFEGHLANEDTAPMSVLNFEQKCSMHLVQNAAVAIALLAATWGTVASILMESVVVYSTMNCVGTPLRLILTVDENCATERGLCDSVEINGAVQYRSISCIDEDQHAYVANIFEGFSYVMLDFYKAAGCEGLNFSTAYLATGTCSTGNTNASVITRLNLDGSATVQSFEGTSCGGEKILLVNATSEDVANHTCIYDIVKVYSSISDSSSADSAGSSSSSVSETLAPSTSEVSSSSSCLSDGAIVGITIGSLLFVLLAAALIIWWCLSKRKQSKTDRYPSDDAERSIDHQGDNIKAGYSAILESTERETIANVHIPRDSSMPQRGSGGMWEDETIVAVRIPRRKVLFQELISRDGYAEVYKGTFNNQLISVKRLSLERQSDPESVADFCSEVKMMAEMDHPRIAQFIGVAWESRADLCAVSEYLDGGDLRTLLDKFTEIRHPVGFDYDKVKIALHVAHALTYLHSLAPPVMHRNLKSKNIVLSSKLDAKLTDFGVSRKQLDCTMTADVGSTLWMAPEVVMGHRYGDKADIYSFGVVLSELDVHSLPYSHAKARDSSLNKMSDTMLLQQIAAGKLQVEFSSGGSGSMRELGMTCVLVDPNQRPTAAEVLYKLHTILTREM